MKHVFIISVHRRHQLVRQKHLMHNVFDASVVRVLDWNLESIWSDGFHKGNRFDSDPVQVPGRVTKVELAQAADVVIAMPVFKQSVCDALHTLHADDRFVPAFAISPALAALSPTPAACMNG